MSTEHYLLDKLEERSYGLGKSGIWTILSHEEWRTEASLARALRKPEPFPPRALFNWSLWAAGHVWPLTGGIRPPCDVPASLDRIVIVSDGFDAPWPEGSRSWPLVWDAYGRADICEAWVDARYGRGLYDVWSVMES